jgi:hypothetical protein
MFCVKKIQNVTNVTQIFQKFFKTRKSDLSHVKKHLNCLFFDQDDHTESLSHSIGALIVESVSRDALVQFPSDKVHTFFLDLHIDGAVDITACNINLREEFIYPDKKPNESLLPTGRSSPRTIGQLL